MVDDDINILGGPLGNELEELVRLKDEVQRDLQILRDERTMLNKDRASLEEYKEHVTRFLDGKFHDLTNGQASATIDPSQEKVLHSSQVIDDATFLEEDDIYNVVGAQKEQVESQAVLRKGESNSFW